ncbi:MULTISPECIES: phage recombination protein Bet [Methylomonas]|uniref:Recombinase n=1 Tax=Methylomonas methanica TaxID=421 RepID=A0A177MPC2_METMH|nr:MULTISPECIES: phage recombination protein Bet [Methylomonas]OAI06699.1 recombinase [Methylomonas methanica]PKM13737.1 MAG: phage recombination protein Bet [Gammaproteobacteria bacterium HGW-Gammaproteobacteria-3]QBC26568.1 phage recombination protein Bet [Methylomonas sp. LW13]
MSNQPRNNPVKTRNLPMPIDVNQVYGISEQSWKVLTDVTFPTAKTPEAIMMALDYCKARKLDIFKKPVHVVPMWSAALGRNVETVWPSIMEIQTTASRTGVWAGMDRPVWGPDITKTFTGRYKDDNEQWQESSVTVTFPEWVAVTVYRIVGGKRCAFTEEVYWQEAYSTAGGKNSQVPTAMWIKRPKGQLAKCGKAASLRAAFPEECGYAAEEMDGKSIDDMNDSSVINGTASRIDEADVIDDAIVGSVEPPRVIDLSMIPPKVQKAVSELVRRTALAGAWKAAYDYANNKFVGLDLTYAIAELDKASAVAKTTSAQGDVNHQPQDASGMPPAHDPASEALNKARETLGSTRQS